MVVKKLSPVRCVTGITAKSAEKADLYLANLTSANLPNADLKNAYLQDVEINDNTTMPNNWKDTVKKYEGSKTGVLRVDDEGNVIKRY